MNEFQKSTKTKVLIYFQIFIVVLAVNPWSTIVRDVAFILVAIEVAMVLFVFCPVFIYQLSIKKLGIRKSTEVALNSLFNILSIFNAVPF